MIQQLWHSVLFICSNGFQQNLQEVLSKFYFTISSEIEVCARRTCDHGIKNKNCQFLKFKKKNQFHFTVVLSGIPLKCLLYCKHFYKSCNVPSYLLFISYKFVKGFWTITFLLLVISSWNFHNVCQRFLYNQEQNPHYENHPLL